MVIHATKNSMILTLICASLHADLPKHTSLLLSKTILLDVFFTHPALVLFFVLDCVHCINEHKPILTHKICDELDLKNKPSDFHKVCQVNLGWNLDMVSCHVLSCLLILKILFLNHLVVGVDRPKKLCILEIIVQGPDSDRLDDPQNFKLGSKKT